MGYGKSISNKKEYIYINIYIYIYIYMNTYVELMIITSLDFRILSSKS